MGGKRRKVAGSVGFGLLEKQRNWVSEKTTLLGRWVNKGPGYSRGLLTSSFWVRVRFLSPFSSPHHAHAKVHQFVAMSDPRGVAETKEVAS